MADPFGTDECDFNQQAMVDGIYRGVHQLSSLPPSKSLVRFVWLGQCDTAQHLCYSGVAFESSYCANTNLACVCAECKRLCEEPEEDFLASIGDPSFNPVRNSDGTLAEEIALSQPEQPESGFFHTQTFRVRKNTLLSRPCVRRWPRTRWCQMKRRR